MFDQRDSFKQPIANLDHTGTVSDNMTQRTVDRTELDLDNPIYGESGRDPDLRYLRFKTTDGVVLSALLFKPPEATNRVLLLIPGLNGGVLGGHHDYRPLARRMAASGIALMLLNMRSSNTFAHSKFEDSRLDIDAAIQWLKSEGLSEIALFGTSLGGPRVMFYNYAIGDPAIRMMGFIASIRSPYLAMSDGPGRDHVQELDEILQKAREAVARGEGDSGITFRHFLPGRPQTMSAASFLSYFGSPNDTKLSTVGFGHAVRVPTLVVHGTADEVANISNARDIYDSLTNAPQRDLIIVTGANHYLTAGWISRAYAEIMGGWVTEKFADAALVQPA